MENNITKKIIQMAKSTDKKIVLPESEDIRIIEAASKITKEKICKIVLIGNENEIKQMALKSKINIDKVEIVNPIKSSLYEKYVEKFYELRKHKKITVDEAKKYMLDNVYFATMMVNEGQADGLVCGACHSTSDTLRPALQIIKQKSGINSVSSCFLMETKDRKLGADGLFVFSDCGLIEEPTEEQLVDIVNSSVQTFSAFSDMKPKVALLSYSTYGSAKSEAVKKIQNVLKKVKEQKPYFDIDGELQLDAAIIKEVAKIKANSSNVAGNANILIFPNLEAGNISYKIAQRFGKMIALGPITQGMKKPVNDLSRGCSIDDIVGVVAITCIQAIKNE